MFRFVDSWRYSENDEYFDRIVIQHPYSVYIVFDYEWKGSNINERHHAMFFIIGLANRPIQFFKE